MQTRIVNGQTFTRGSVVKGLVGGNQSDPSGPSSLMTAADFERPGELNSVVGAQRVPVTKPHRVFQQSRCHLDDCIPSAEMSPELMQHRRRAPRRQCLAFAT